MHAHSASDEHSCSHKSDCCQTSDRSIPKTSPECFVNRQTITVEPPPLQSRGYASHDQNHNQVETVANNNGRRAQRASIDMELRREECDRGLLEELDYKENYRGENKESPAMSQTFRTEEQPFYSAHSGKITYPSIRAHILMADYRMK